MHTHMYTESLLRRETTIQEYKDLFRKQGLPCGSDVRNLPAMQGQV